ncbi:spindle and kinetochore-associated protein 3 [Rhinatrema bivittatum]|uniref:spindle and kinetochore-associated protein 3 n=1 Tax=Rhinatrema bivittatum TaxID=194408 RepID=UPI00112C8EA8|nr:spindle and kinetochore-associated protein 3 [Rhinatrema bivittatum]XP_029458390.1 spindle and kinetochore-associated protein 3 [Rhinatrema bivittatum]
MAVTANFFGKLRALALTLEKETQHLEHAFSKEDLDLDGYEDECPMRVLHDLHSEIKAMKGSIQTTTDQTHSKGEEIAEFLRACKVLKQKTTVDLENIKNIFEKYGYKTLPMENLGKEQETGCPQSETSVQEQMEDKFLAPRDPLKLPQLSEFGLSHYQLQTKNNLVNYMAFNQIAAHKEEPEDIEAPASNPEFIMPKMPTCTLNMDDDAFLESCFPRLELNDDYTMKLNDDYTMALINKKAQERKNVPEGKAVNEHAEQSTLFHDVTMPVPSIHLSHMSDVGNINSPLPPIFCTPGIKSHKKESIDLVETPETAEPSINKSTPQVPSFETQYLKNEAVDCSSCFQMKQHVELAPPLKILDYERILQTPQRPEMTSSVMGDIFKILPNYVNIKTPTPLKLENMKGAPRRYEGKMNSKHIGKENGGNTGFINDNILGN